MGEYNIPKGVSLDTLKEIVAGWFEAGAAQEPQYTADVQEVTSVSDVVGRQSRFLEDIGVLDRHNQRHKLTDHGRAFANALAESDQQRASEHARDILSDWDLTRAVLDSLEGGPMERAELVQVVANLTEQTLDTSRVETGLTTLLDLYEWAGLLERDPKGRYQRPLDGPRVGESAEATGDIEQAIGSIAEQKVAEAAEATTRESAERLTEEIAEETAAQTTESKEQTMEKAPSETADEVTQVRTREGGGFEVTLGDGQGVEINVDGNIDVREGHLPDGVQIDSNEEEVTRPSETETQGADSGVENGALDEQTNIELSQTDETIRIDVDADPEVTIVVTGDEVEGKSEEAELEGPREELAELAATDADGAQAQNGAVKPSERTDDSNRPAEPELATGESASGLVAELAKTARETREAATAAKVAAEAAQATNRDDTTDDAASAEPHAISLDIDVDPDTLEAIVRAIQLGLTTDE